MTTPSDTWLTRREAADRLKCSPATIDRRAREGRLRKRVSGGLVRFHSDDLDALFHNANPFTCGTIEPLTGTTCAQQVGTCQGHHSNATHHTTEGHPMTANGETYVSWGDSR